MFVDESGDHNLRNIDRSFPIFCLVGCVFERGHYKNVVRPMVEALKVHFWGTADVILHSREIRKHQGAFSLLGDPVRRTEFYAAVNDLLRGLEFTILAVVILKEDHLLQYGSQARHPYHLALSFVLERYALVMQRCGGRESTGYILAESRGLEEDSRLKAEYQQLVRQGPPDQDLRSITGLWMEKKQANIAGLQIADLVAYPIAAKVLRPDAEQRAFDVLYEKIDAAPLHKGGSILGYGLKIFPQASFDHYLLWGAQTKREP